MATFYKTKGDKGAAKEALKKAKEKYKVGTALYNTLDTLEKKGEIDYKALSKETGKDVASYNNPKSRGVLEKDLADFIEFEVGKRGRKVDPETAKKKAAKAAAKAEKSGKANKESGVDFSVLDKTVSSTKDSSKKDIDKGINKVIAKAKKGTKVKLGKGVRADKDSLEILDTHKAKMQDVAKEYKAAKESGDEVKAKKLTSKLKDMTAKRKELQKSHEEISAGIGKDDELQAED
jgi:hypothetical protein